MTITARPTLAASCVIAALATTATVTAVATAAKAPAKATVTLKASKFTPATTTISKGGTITWVWRDGNTPHDVVGAGFRSAIVTKGSFKHRFAKTGTFRYICSIHPKMRGTVVVR